MISYEVFCKIHDYSQRQGLTVPQIARELGLDPKTVAKWIKVKSFTPRQSSSRTSKLDPYKTQIVRWLESHAYSATQIFQRLKEIGYDGGYSIVKEYVRVVRPVRPPAFLTLSFEPGECAQVDWGEYGSVKVGSTRRRLSFLVMVLCDSRQMYVEFTVSQTMEHFLSCHQNAFQFFGGAPKKVMVDNLKSAVLQRQVGQAPVFNPRYMDFAHHYGFKIVACNVRKGNEKGRVENGVGYVKKNFLNGLEIPGFSAVNPAVRNWLDTIANVRVHGETHGKPIDRFEIEKKALQALPAQPYDVSVIHTVRASNRFRVSLDSNRYSVPAEYASTALTLKAYPDRVVVYHQDQLIAQHVRRYDRHQDYELPDHPKELLTQRRKADEQTLLRRFLTLSPRAEYFYQELQNKNLNTRHLLRQILALSEIYGVDKADLLQILGDTEQSQALCALLKTTSPKIYKDQLLGTKQIVSAYGKQYGAIEPEHLSRLINTPRLTATGLRERLLAFQHNPEKNNDSQIQQHTHDQVNQGNSSLAHYAALNGHPSGQGVNTTPNPQLFAEYLK